MRALGVSEKSIKKGVIFLSYLKKCTLKSLSNNLLKIRKYYKTGISSRVYFAIFIWWLCCFVLGIYLSYKDSLVYTLDFEPCGVSLEKQNICYYFGGSVYMYLIYLVTGFYALYIGLYFVSSFPGVLISLLLTIAYIHRQKKSINMLNSSNGDWGHLVCKLYTTNILVTQYVLN